MAAPRRSTSVRTSELTLRIEDPDAPLDTVRIRRRTGEALDEKLLLEALDSFETATVALNRAFTLSGITAEDCVQIHTGSCTTIKINCPVEDIVIVEDR